MRTFTPYAVYLFIALSLPAAKAQTVSFDEGHRQWLARNPVGVVFTLRLKEGKSQFHAGETIGILLEFSSARTNAYVLDAATYDRSGRLPSELWIVDRRDGVTDPLVEYFREGVFSGGGLRSMPVLTETPHVIELDLNEWLRFSRPGKYRLYDTSVRIIDEADPCGAQREKPVTSNWIDFEILPANPEWEEARLVECQRTLDERSRREEHRKAARTIRFLDTAAAARELVKRLGEEDRECGFEYQLGLISSPHRDLILCEMENRLAEPEFPISGTFLYAFAKLRYLKAQPDAVPPPPASSDGAQLKQWQETLRARLDLQSQFQATTSEELLNNILAKQGRARVTSQATLIETASNLAVMYRSIGETEDWKKLRADFTGNFELLPADKQISLLQYRWAWIKSPEFVPVLLRLLNEGTGQDVQGRNRRGLMLKRLYELSPTKGRELIIQEIRHPRQDSDPTALSLLPETTLPELDEVLVGQLEKAANGGRYESLAVCCSLIGRYAAGSIVERVKKVYEKASRCWACDIEAPLLRYFLRVAPDYGVAAVKNALTLTTTGCKHNLLTRLADPNASQLLEPLAIANLWHDDPEVAADCAKFLRDYGSSLAEAALRERLQKFHTEWKNRADELCYRYGTQNKHTDQAQLESSLVNAWGEGLRWFSNESKLQEIESLCVTSNALNQVRSWRRSFGTPMTINRFQFDDREEWRLAQYTLKSLEDLQEKLAQFPKGTVFSWQSSVSQDPVSAEREEAVFRTLRQWLILQGMQLEK